MSLEVSCEQSTYSTKYEPLYKPCYAEIEDHVAFKEKVSKQKPLLKKKKK